MAKPIKVEILGDASGFTKALDTAGSGLGNLGKMVGTAGLALGGLALGGLAAATKGLADLGARFDDVSDTIRVTTGATGAALEGLNQSFKNVAKEAASPLEDVGTAIANINQRLELTGKPLEDVTTQFLNLSRITDTDLQANIDNITRLFGDWNVAAKDQTKVMDELFRATQSSGIGLDALTTLMVQFGAPLRNLGFSLQESEAMLALWNKTGVNTELAMSGLKIAVGNLAKEGKNAPVEIQKVIDKIFKLGPGAEATGLAIETFGKKAGPDLVDAITGAKFSIEDILGTIVNGQDTINQATADTDDWAEAWQRIKNKVLIGLEPVATRVFSAVGTGLDKWVAPAFTRAQDAIGAFKGAWERADGTVTQSGLNGVMERLANIIQQSLWPWLQELGNSLQIMAVMAWPIFEDAIRGAYVIFKTLIDYARDHETVMLGLKVTILGLAVAAGIAALALGSVAAVLGGLIGVTIIAIAGVVGTITKFFLWIKERRQEWIDNIKAPFVEGFGWIERKWSDLKSTFTNPFGGLGLGSLGGRAMGGSVGTSGMYRINERSTPGGETVFLPAGSRVQPNYAGGGGRGDVFNIYAPNATPAQVASEIAWKRRMGNGR